MSERNPLTDLHERLLRDDIRPDWMALGSLPHCSERCPSHDGKRCEQLGHRPDEICEPAVIAMGRALKEVARGS